MTFLKRLRVLPAILGVAAALTAVGTSLFGDARDPVKVAGPGTQPRPEAAAIDDTATRFAAKPVVVFQPKAGETIFAWQVKPDLPVAPARPRDILVMVDTSASQAGKPIQQARQIITALGETAAPEDRIAVWTVCTPASTKPLTNGFQPGNSDDLKAANAALGEIEYGSGATDLKYAMSHALAQPTNPGRQQIILFLGDGDSAYDPLSEADRVAIGSRLDLHDLYFFAVPLGVKVNPYTLHGLASLTGGTVVRVQEDLNNPAQRTQFASRLAAAFAVPVVKPEKFQFGPEVAEFYPTKVPPLRADRATLVIGKLKDGAANVALNVKGKVAGTNVNLNLAHPVPATQPDHFFLHLMLEQWRGAPNKEAPAVLQADRALALASTQVRLYRDEYLTQAVWAVTMDKLDEATGLYQAARRVDPTDAEAAAGLVMVENLKSGKLNKDDLKKRLAAASDGLKVDKDKVVRTVVQEAAAQQPDPKAQPMNPAAQPPNAADLLKEAAAKRKVEEERYRVLVSQTITRARQMLRVDPDQAYGELKRQRDEILGYEGIGDQARAQMVGDLEAVMREIFVKGSQIKREAAAEREQIARVTQRLNEFNREQNDNERTRARIDAFRQLMQQARYELAYQEAQLMIQERVARGQIVPQESVASYIIGQQATQLREWRELVRIREDRFLLAMMQTEKSHIPYPDEPPVHFPPAAVWRELTKQRKGYANQLLGPEPSPTQLKIQDALENKRVSYQKNLRDVRLEDLLRDLSTRYDVTFIIMEEHFRNAGVQNIGEMKPNLNVDRLEGLTLGSFLDVVLSSIQAPTGVTFIVRPDYIEITTYEKRLEEKVTRVFPVADLAIPIPDSVNQQTLMQNLSIQQQTLAIFGAASLYGGGLNNFLGGGGNIGGGGGGNPFGQGAGGQQGNQNQGAFFQNQGGIVGLGGQQNIGQFGNLGGQFGLQGGDQSQILIGTIYETVAKGEWAIDPNFAQQLGLTPEAATSFLPVPQQNSLGYYPPARALIVRGTSRYHGYASLKLKPPAGMAAGPGNGNNGVIVIGPGANPNPNNPKPKDGVAANPKPANNPIPAGPIVIGPDNKPGIVDPKMDPQAIMARLDKDPRRKWQQVIDWTVTDPGLIVASAEFLIELNQPAHAAEILKANLRKGLATDTWAHEALGVALVLSQANPIEVERAALAGIDLDPADHKAYLRAAKAEAELKKHDFAFTLCQRAAAKAPDQPEAYANALVYAEQAKDVRSDAVAWAADNLLKRDWVTADGVDYHKTAREKVDVLVKKFDAAGVKADALKRVQVEQNQRDLVIELIWQGPADLDLMVTEPSGAVCSAGQRRTSGGGLLKGDVLEQKDDDGRTEAYTAASAFTGTYKVNVRQAFGRPVGGTAQLKVTKFKGTPREAHDLIPIDPANPKVVEIKLDGGTRTELAVVTDDANDIQARLDAGNPEAGGPVGLGGGVGPAGKALTTGVEEANGPRLPVVVKPREQVLQGLGGAADIRAQYKLNPDRRTYSLTVNPVFATAKGPTTLPKVPLLPGGEDGP